MGVIVLGGSRRVRFRHRRPVDRGRVVALAAFAAVYVGTLFLGVSAVLDVAEAFR